MAYHLKKRKYGSEQWYPCYNLQGQPIVAQTIEEAQAQRDEFANGMRAGYHLKLVDDDLPQDACVTSMQFQGVGYVDYVVGDQVLVWFDDHRPDMLLPIIEVERAECE